MIIKLPTVFQKFSAIWFWILGLLFLWKTLGSSYSHCSKIVPWCISCWVCKALPSSLVEGFLWSISPLQGKDFLQVCKYFQQQSYVMPLLHLMISNNPKMDCATLCTLTMDITRLLILIILKGCCWITQRRQDSWPWRRRIQSRARDEAWLLRAFV